MCSFEFCINLFYKGLIKSLYFQIKCCKSIFIVNTQLWLLYLVITTAGLNSGELELWKWETIIQAYQHGQINEKQEKYTPYRPNNGSPAVICTDTYGFPETLVTVFQKRWNIHFYCINASKLQAYYVWTILETFKCFWILNHSLTKPKPNFKM